MHEAVRVRAYEGWLENARGGAEPQRPETELLAEHHLMLCVLAAMEEEARRLLQGQPLRPKFWKGVVEFIGNFIHRVHRLKEEKFFFPALESWGLLEPDESESLGEDHEKLKELTWLLCDGVNEGDWEKAFRVVAIYLARMRAHIETEERGLVSPELAAIDDDRVRPVAEGFTALESEVLGRESRLEFVAIAHSLCLDVGISPPSMATGDSH